MAPLGEAEVWQDAQEGAYSADIAELIADSLAQADRLGRQRIQRSAQQRDNQQGRQTRFICFGYLQAQLKLGSIGLVAPIKAPLSVLETAPKIPPRAVPPIIATVLAVLDFLTFNSLTNSPSNA